MAIRRDVGLNLKVTEHKRVCLRHFKPSVGSDVLSIFPWKNVPPAKFKAPDSIEAR